MYQLQNIWLIIHIISIVISYLIYLFNQKSMLRDGRNEEWKGRKKNKNHSPRWSSFNYVFASGVEFERVAKK